MDVVLGHNTAFEYWVEDPSRYVDPKYSKIQFLDDCIVRDKDIAQIDLPQLGFTGLPIDILVPTACHRRPSKTTACHVVGDAPLPPRSLVRIAKNVVVASPEFCLLQLAQRSTPISLALRCFRVCGDYRTSSNPGESAREGHRVAGERFLPLTSIDGIREYLGTARNMHGSAKLSEVLEYVCDNAASPMEARLVMALCLPTSRGGGNVRLPSLNHRVELSPKGHAILGRKACSCDLYWDGVCVEYDSDRWHTGPDRIEWDARRRNALAASGIEVITITKHQLMNPALFGNIVSLVKKSIGQRDRNRCTDYEQKRAQLYRELFGFLK